MFELKSLSQEGVDKALSKVERYRLLNEPWEAESICLDVLKADPENQHALVSLLLSLTDQLGLETGDPLTRAQELIPRLDSEYKQAYYSGIICERRAKSLLRHDAAGAGPVIFDWLRRAMDWYDKAETLRPPNNEDAIIRWNTCARIIMRHEHLRPASAEPQETMLE